jgi:hypothetical protein
MGEVLAITLDVEERSLPPSVLFGSDVMTMPPWSSDTGTTAVEGMARRVSTVRWALRSRKRGRASTR